MITIDGSVGEGGGQMLRSALTLSMATTVPFRIQHIRAGRQKPGLLRQHLTAVTAAATITGARVEGASLRSTDLTFYPGPLLAGDHTFSVGSAGSASLVLQTILPPLLRAGSASTLAIEGGTHNPMAPPFDFLERAFLPLVNRVGPQVSIRLDRHGFYPAGGGRLAVSIRPALRHRPLELLARGAVTARRVRVLLSGLPRHIADRELATALSLLNWPDACGTLEIAVGAHGPGNVIFVELESEHVTEVFTGFGETGTRAEAVAEAAVRQFRRHIATDAPVGEHLADQLLVVLALGGGGTFRTVAPSAHTTTNARVIEQFLGARILIENEARDIARITVKP